MVIIKDRQVQDRDFSDIENDPVPIMENTGEWVLTRLKEIVQNELDPMTIRPCSKVETWGGMRCENYCRFLACALSSTKQMSKEITTDTWYPTLLDECRDVITEKSFAARWEIIEGKHELGFLIRQAPAEFPVTELLRRLAVDLNLKERTLWYCVQFYDQFPELAKFPGGKNVAWHKICHEYLPSPKAGQEKPSMPPSSDPVPPSSYLEYVRNHFCVVCGKSPAEAAHFPKTTGAGAPDYWVIPLCRECHSEHAQHGRLDMGARHTRSIGPLISTA